MAAGVAVMLCGGAAAQDVQNAAQAPEKKICRNVMATGSIMAKRICLSKDEWSRFHDLNGKHADMRDRRGNNVDTRGLGDREWGRANN
jgi:hypothetical protein